MVRKRERKRGDLEPHPWFTAANLSDRTSATALCGTTGIPIKHLHIYIYIYCIYLSIYLSIYIYIYCISIYYIHIWLSILHLFLPWHIKSKHLTGRLIKGQACEGKLRDLRNGSQGIGLFWSGCLATGKGWVSSWQNHTIMAIYQL